MTIEDFRPTHVVPQDGLPAWEAPDVSRPTEPLDPLLPVQLVDRRGDWGRILCANGWSAWVDGRLLVAVPHEPPAAGQPLARTADPRPLLARVEESLSQYRQRGGGAGGRADRRRDLPPPYAGAAGRDGRRRRVGVAVRRRARAVGVLRRDAAQHVRGLAGPAAGTTTDGAGREAPDRNDAQAAPATEVVDRRTGGRPGPGRPVGPDDDTATPPTRSGPPGPVTPDGPRPARHEPARRTALRPAREADRRLPGRERDRPRRHGRRLPRQGPAAGPHRRAETARPRTRPQRHLPQALHPRVAGGRRDRPPAHRAGLRGRRDRRHPLHRHALRRRTGPARAARPQGPAARWRRPAGSPPRWRPRSTPPTTTTWCTGTSNPATSWSRRARTATTPSTSTSRTSG